MNYKSIKHLGKLISALFLICASTSEAIMTLTITEQGNDVVASYTGSLETFNFLQNTSYSDQVIYSAGFFALSSSVGQAQQNSAGLSLSSGTWTGSFANASSQSGDAFGFNGSFTYAPIGYTAGNDITGSLTFLETNLTDLGLTEGQSAIFTGGGNTFNVNISAAVPEPSTYALFLGLATIGFLALRRRQ